MSQININKLTFGYEGSYDNIFENISINIDTDWRLGLVGRNGRGKTTLLKLLMGEMEYQGNITASVDFEYFPFEIKDKSLLVFQVIDEISEDYQHWMLVKELSLLELEEDILYRVFNSLSNGEQSKVLLATLFLKENSFLLIDEPTNHLDVNARQIISEYLKKKKGFILISHDKAFLNNCVDHIVSINKTNIDIEKGDFDSWWKNKTDRDNFEIYENQKLMREIDVLGEAAKRTNKWSGEAESKKFAGKNPSGLRPDRGFLGHKAAKIMKRAKCMENRMQTAIEEKKKLLKNFETIAELKLSPLKPQTKRVARFENLSIMYGANTVCAGITFGIDAGERVAICGKNGSGKTSILKLLNGQDITYNGGFYKANDLGISYICQDTSNLCGSIFDFSRHNNIEQTKFMTILRMLDFERIQFEKDIADYSCGQKKKVLLAKSLCQDAHLYIWDEPLNFIDIFSRMQIENLLTKYKPTMVFVEHDKDFCEKIATKTIYL